MAEAARPTKTTCKISHVHIECPICLTRFIDPKILDCQHSFCLKCLQELIDKQVPKTDIIICPVCRRKTSIPDEGLSALLNCFFLSSLIDDVINLEGPKEDINPPVSTCEGCDEGLEAVSRCVDCEVNFCTTCLEIHAKLKSNKHHQIANAVGSSNERPKDKDKTESPKCGKHTDQKLCFYCDTCDLLACPKCAVLDHRASNHNLSEINESIRSYRRAIDEALQKFDECRKQFQKVDDSIKHSQHTLQLMVNRALRDIMAKEKEEIAKIRNASHLLQERVTQISQERGVEFESIQSSNRDKMSRAEQIVASVNDLMQHADDFELLDLKTKVMHNITFHKEPQFEQVQHSKSFIGFKGHDIFPVADLGEILEEEKWEVKTEFGKKRKVKREFKMATDVACITSNSDIVVTDAEKCSLSTITSMGIYKSTGVQSGTEDGKLKYPYGVAVTSDDLLLVTDGQDVKVYDRELRYIRQFRPSQNKVERQQSESKLSGIAVDKKDRIAVADCKRKVISLHNIDGSTISTIHHDDVGFPCFLSEGSNERQIFTNYDKMKLVCLDFVGNEVFNISTSFDGKLVKPTGVCCDDAGDIYVSITHGKRGTCEILHYDASGEHIGCVARGLYNPLGMTFTPTGDLIVADLLSVKVLHRV